jgi:alpha-N-arabinofuranosidase
MNIADSNNMILITSQALLSHTGTVQLKMEANRDKYAFYFNTGKGWELVKEGVDGKFLSTKTAGGFVGSTIGLYATSLGAKSNNTAYFDWFEYKGNDEVYRLDE